MDKAVFTSPAPTQFALYLSVVQMTSEVAKSANATSEESNFDLLKNATDILMTSVKHLADTHGLYPEMNYESGTVIYRYEYETDEADEYKDDFNRFVEFLSVGLKIGLHAKCYIAPDWGDDNVLPQDAEFLSMKAELNDYQLETFNRHISERWDFSTLHELPTFDVDENTYEDLKALYKPILPIKGTWAK